MSGIEMVPSGGRLTAMISENLPLIPRTLFYEIELPLEPFEFDGELQQTSVSLSHIDFARFGIRSWRELPGKEFSFPKNPNDGYIDGSVYLDAAHNPADTTGIRFGVLRGDLLAASFDIDFDFTFEGLQELGVVSVVWDVDLRLDPEKLDRTVREFGRGGG